MIMPPHQVLPLRQLCFLKFGIHEYAKFKTVKNNNIKDPSEGQDIAINSVQSLYKASTSHEVFTNSGDTIKNQNNKISYLKKKKITEMTIEVLNIAKQSQSNLITQLQKNLHLFDLF